MNAHPSLTGQVNVREISVSLLFFFSFLLCFYFHYNPFASIYSGKSLLWKLNWLKAVSTREFRFNGYFRPRFIQSFKLTAVAGTIEVSAER